MPQQIVHCFVPAQWIPCAFSSARRMLYLERELRSGVMLTLVTTGPRDTGTGAASPPADGSRRLTSSASRRPHSVLYRLWHSPFRFVGSGSPRSMQVAIPTAGSWSDCACAYRMEGGIPHGWSCTKTKGSSGIPKCRRQLRIMEFCRQV